MATHSSVLAWRIPGTRNRWAAVYGVAQSRTRLKWLSSSSSTSLPDRFPAFFSFLFVPSIPLALQNPDSWSSKPFSPPGIFLVLISAYQVSLGVTCTPRTSSLWPEVLGGSASATWLQIPTGQPCVPLVQDRGLGYSRCSISLADYFLPNLILVIQSTIDLENIYWGACLPSTWLSKQGHLEVHGPSVSQMSIQMDGLQTHL